MQKSDRFVDRGDALAGAKHCPTRQDEKAAAKMSTHFLKITGVDVRVLSRQVHFAHDRGAVIGTMLPFIRFGPRDACRKERGENDEGVKRIHPFLEATAMPFAGRGGQI